MESESAEQLLISKPRFDLISDEEKQNLLENRKAQSTNRATKQWVQALSEYLIQSNMPTLENIDNENLPDILGNFYFSIRKQPKKSPKKKNKNRLSLKSNPDPNKDDRFYKNSSLKSARAALNRHFKAERGLDIIASESFIKANEIFQAVTKKGKVDGRGEIQNKPAITEEDMNTLSNYFIKNMQGPPNAKLLQEIVLFNIIYYGGRRGRENLRFMTKNTFQICTDNDGRRYLHQIIKECDKNHKEDDMSESDEARIYEIKGQNNICIKIIVTLKIAKPVNKQSCGMITQREIINFIISDSKICPVSTFELYLSKLNPTVDYLWQRPKTKFDPYTAQYWFDAAPIGRDPLNWHMKIISKKAGLSQIYTNHCIRATVITTLDDKGFEARHIMATTGHKSESSIRSYAKKCPPQKRRKISDALASNLHTEGKENETKKAKNQETSMVPVAQSATSENVSVDNPPVMDLFPTFDPDEDIPDDQILDVLTQIENTTSNLVQQNENQKTINVNSVSTVSNVNKSAPMMPGFYFHNSNVTINYYQK